MPLSRINCTSAISATFDASRREWNIDSPANSRLMRTP